MIQLFMSLMIALSIISFQQEETWELVAVLGEGSFHQAAMHEDQLIVASSTGLRLYTIESGGFSPVTILDDRIITHVAWSPDGALLAYTVSPDSNQLGELHIWDGTASRATGIIPLDFEFSPDGRYLSARGEANTHILTLDDFTITELDPASQFAWSPDGTQFSTFDAAFILRLWDTATLSVSDERQLDEFHQIDWLPSGEIIYGRRGLSEFVLGDDIIAIPDNLVTRAWSPDARYLAGNDETRVQVWDVQTGEVISEFTTTPQQIAYLGWTPDNMLIVRAYFYDETILWQDGDIVYRTAQPIGDYLGIYDGQIITTDNLYNIQIIEIATDNVTDTLNFTSPGGYAIIEWVSPTEIMTYGNCLVNFWDITTQQIRLQDPSCGEILDGILPYGNVTSLQAGAGDLFGYAPESVIVYDWDTQTSLELTGHTAGINTLAWSADDTHLLSVSSDGTIRVWQISDGELTGEQLRVIEAEGVTRAIFNDDASQVMAGNQNGEIIIWDVETGAELTRFMAHPNGVNDLDWYEGQLVTAGFDGVLKVWR